MQDFRKSGMSQRNFLKATSMVADIHARLVATKAIGCIDQPGGVRLFEDKAKRVVHVDFCRINLSQIDQS